MKRLMLVMLVAVVLSLSISVYANDTYTPISYPGALETYAYAINDAETIVGTYSDASKTKHGYFLTGGVYTPLDVPGASNTSVVGINNSGTIVGWYTDTGGLIHGFFLTGGIYTLLNAPDASKTYAYGIDNSGTVVGEYWDASGEHGYFLTGTTYSPLDYPGASGTYAYGINHGGTITGVYVASGVRHGFSLTGTTYAPIDYPGASETGAIRINDAGTIVGWYYGLPGKAFSLAGTRYTTLDCPSGWACSANGINNAGAVVGWYTDSAGTHGFLAHLEPKAMCQDATVNAGPTCTTTVSIDNGSFEPNGNAVTLNQSPAGPYSLGTTHVALTVADSKNPSSQSTCNGTVTVADKTPPAIPMTSVNPSVLWPPNHQMVNVTVNYTVTDNCGQPACKISGVTSNEPISSSDYSIVDPHHVKLSADRLGSGNGRMYTIAIGCTDASGNSSTQTVAVSVPHDQGKN